MGGGEAREGREGGERGARGGERGRRGGERGARGGREGGGKGREGGERGREGGSRRGALGGSRRGVALIIPPSNDKWSANIFLMFPHVMEPSIEITADNITAFSLGLQVQICYATLHNTNYTALH